MTDVSKAKPSAALAQPPQLHVSRIFHHAPRKLVFAAWSSADHVKRWFSPETYSVPEARVEMRVGGPFEVMMRSPAGDEHWTRGVFVEIVPDQRLVIDMDVLGADGAVVFKVRTEADFTDETLGTRLDVVQTYTLTDPAVAAAMVGGAKEGWRTTLDKLESELVRMQGASDSANRSVVHAIFHLERRYPATAERVWTALTDQAAKDKWFGGPKDAMTLIERTMDVRPGGRERAKGRWKGGLVTTFDAVYFDVIENQRLVYGYEMHLDERKISVSLATIQLEAKGGETVLKVTEQGAFLDGYDDAGSREHGTGVLLDAIGASLSG